MIKIWVDDERPMPEDYNYLSFTTNFTVWFIQDLYYDNIKDDILVSLDHNAGKYADRGGDYVKVLEKFETLCYEDSKFQEFIKNKITFHLHTANPVGRENMRRIIRKNGWREV